MVRGEYCMAEIDELIKANEKLGKLIALNVDERNQTKWLRKAQLKTNKILGEIRDYKEQQKQGDIRSRKRSELYSKVGIGIALIGTVIALVAVYISITGLDGRVARFFTGLIGGL